MAAALINAMAGNLKGYQPTYRLSLMNDSFWTVTEMIEKCFRNGSTEVECNILGLFNTKEEAEEVKTQYKPTLASSSDYMIGNHQADVMEIKTGKQCLTLGSLYFNRQ